MAIVAVFALFAVMFHACDKNQPDELSIVSMTVGNSDLNSAQAPDDVPVDASIVVEFNSDIKAGTATSDNISLIQDYDQADISIQISVEGPMLTVTPDSSLGNGILYNFELASGLLNVDDQPLAQTQRSFTTTGTFSPPGVVAEWTFEDTAEDVVGDYDPPSSGIVDITYEASRNSAAGQAASFNGNTSIIEIPNADPLVTTNDFTITFWVKTNSTDHVNDDGDPAGHFVIGLGAFYGIQYEIAGNYLSSKFSNQYELGDGSTAAEDMWFPANATYNSNGGWQGWDYAVSLSEDDMRGLLKDSWLHVTLTYNSGERKAKLLMNGNLMKSFDFDLWPEGAAKRTVQGLKYGGEEPEVINELAFGFIHSRDGTLWDNEPWGNYENPEANHFKGLLDDVKIYHKVLTETEIELMFESEE